MTEWRVGDRVIAEGPRKEVGRVGMILDDGLIIVDYDTKGSRSLSFRPEQLKRPPGRRR